MKENKESRPLVDFMCYESDEEEVEVTTDKPGKPRMEVVDIISTLDKEMDKDRLEDNTYSIKGI